MSDHDLSQSRLRRTSRNTLAMIRQSGVEPTVIEWHLKDAAVAPKASKNLISAMGIPVRAAAREMERRSGNFRHRRSQVDRRTAYRPDAGASDPDQPPHRRHVERRQAVPSVGGRARYPAKSGHRTFRQGRRRGRSRAGSFEAEPPLGRERTIPGDTRVSAPSDGNSRSLRGVLGRFAGSQDDRRRRSLQELRYQRRAEPFWP